MVDNRAIGPCVVSLNAMNHALHPDVLAVARIDAVPKILEVITRVTGLRFAAIARVTESQWIACAVRDDLGFGLAVGGELELETTICNEIRQHRRPVVFQHASEHPAFAKHHTSIMYGLESYISVPLLRSNGEFFGTLCAIDPRPTQVEAPEIIQLLELFAQLIGSELETAEKLELSQTALHSALDVAKMREQLIGEVSNDLRDPLQTIMMDAYALRMEPDIGENAQSLATSIENEAWKMAAVIGGMTDFNHDKLTPAVPIGTVAAATLSADFRHTLSQLAAQHPDRGLAFTCDIRHDADCDPRRLNQLLANLVKTVFRHCPAENTVSAHVTTSALQLIILIQAHGLVFPAGGIDSDTRLIDKLSRGAGPNAWDLFIANEVARSHHGAVSAVATAGGGLLSFSMPRARPPSSFYAP